MLRYHPYRVRSKPIRLGFDKEALKTIPVPRKEKVYLNPDPHQPKKWRRPIDLPHGEFVPDINRYTTPGFDPGHSFVVREHVRAGDAISIYNTREIPKAQALKEKESNRYIYLHKNRQVYLDSKPFAGRTKEWMAAHHQVAGLINASLQANAKFEEVGEYCVAVAHPNEIFPGSLVTINYGL